MRSPITLWSSSPALVSVLLNASRRLGLPLRVPSSREVMSDPSSICRSSLIVTDSDDVLLPERCTGRRLVLDPHRPLYSVVKLAWSVLGVSGLLVGVDPGKHVGLAALTHGAVVYGVVTSVDGLRSFVSDIASVASEFNAFDKVLAGIGSSPAVSRAAAEVYDVFASNHLEAVMVDENGSNSAKIPGLWMDGEKLNPHVRAALVIALRAGSPRYISATSARYAALYAS